MNGGAITVLTHNIASLLNCTFINNYAISNGGAIYSDFYNSLTITNTIFKGNSASSSGGAFWTSIDTILLKM